MHLQTALRSVFCLLTLSVTAVANAQLQVSSDFEGGNAEVVSLDQATATVRIMPALREGRGWPCWWYFKLDGLTVGQTVTVEEIGRAHV